MLFTSLPFVLLIACTLAVYYLPALRRFQVALLTLASFLFYGWSQPELTLLLAASCLINAVCSWRVLTGASEARLAWAAGGVVANLAILSSFKYARLFTGLFIADPAALDGPVGMLVNLPLPIGISFFTFQGISLLVDAWRSRRDGSDLGLDPQIFRRHLVEVTLFKGFFPQLVAGPIVKAGEWWPQREPKTWKLVDGDLAIRALITGYFLKMVVADNLKDQTEWIQFPLFLHRSGIDLAAMLFGYSMQIFADFAGYSLIAIGLAALFGYRLPDNFRFPYIAASVSAFWRRWHISLSSWLREYLYLPLGGNRKGNLRTYLNLMLVMLIGGLWHGAAWSYLVWGGWHGLALCCERPLLGLGQAWANHPLVLTLRIAAVFAFVSLSWLLFKLPEFGHAIDYLRTMCTGFDRPATPKLLLIVAILSAPVVIYHADHLARGTLRRLAEAGRGTAYIAMVLATVFNAGSTQSFIYFQF